MKYAAETDYDQLSTDPFKNRVLGDYFQGVHEEDSNLDVIEDSFVGIEPNNTFHQWLSGWTDAVTEFWEEINTKLAA